MGNHDGKRYFLAELHMGNMRRHRMFIRKVKIHNFKCYRDFEITLEEGLNIVVGDNEAGKSTILEAINLALTGIVRHCTYSTSIHNNRNLFWWG